MLIRFTYLAPLSSNPAAAMRLGLENAAVDGRGGVRGHIAMCACPALTYSRKW